MHVKYKLLEYMSITTTMLRSLELLAIKQIHFVRLIPCIHQQDLYMPILSMHVQHSFESMIVAEVFQMDLTR